MLVNMGENVYEMNRRQYKEFLKTAKKCFPFGVYAIEKDNVAIMLNEKPKDAEDLKKQVGEYTAQGFKVHYNGGK